MNRTGILNYLIKKNGFKSYLEIGVRAALNFNVINIESKEGVDPAGNCKYVMTSDNFFKQNTKFYDVIFIDGLHIAEQVTRDIYNSLTFLNKNGMIVLHDCNPKEEWYQVEVYKGGGIWTGTVWKAIALLRISDPNVNICVVDTDHGIGIIRPGNQKLFNAKVEDFDYKFLNDNRKELLNLVSEKEFVAEMEGLKK